MSKVTFVIRWNPDTNKGFITYRDSGATYEIADRTLWKHSSSAVRDARAIARLRILKSQLLRPIELLALWIGTKLSK
jgi:hypothetical protein